MFECEAFTGWLGAEKMEDKEGGNLEFLLFAILVITNRRLEMIENIF